MNAMVSRTMGALMLTGMLAGQAAAAGEDGQFEDWKVVKTFSGDIWASPAVAPSCPRVYNITMASDPYRSDNGGDDWTTYVTNDKWVFPIFSESINPSDPNLLLTEFAG